MNADLLERIERGLKEVRSRTLIFQSSSSLQGYLSDDWGLPMPAIVLGHAAVRMPDVRYDAIRAKSISPPPWLVGMASSFHEDTARVDKKLKGRVFDAIAELSANVLEPRGDTLKPLAAEFKGCWRYRIGDYRMIFLPDKKLGKITLIGFLPRGAAYD